MKQPDTSVRSVTMISNKAINYDVLENMPDLEVHISEQVYMSLVYISGYVCRTESEEDGNSTLYYEESMEHT